MSVHRSACVWSGCELLKGPSHTHRDFMLQEDTCVWGHPQGADTLNSFSRVVYFLSLSHSLHPKTC